MLEKDAVDARDLMITDQTKWMRISHVVMQAGLSTVLRDGAACKAKWNQILPDYKRISDYLGRTGRNTPEYWQLSPTDRREEGLPKQFSEEVFHAIDEWNGNRPLINPPHVRDLLAANDGNYREQHQQNQHTEEDNSEEESHDPVDPATADVTDSTPPRSPVTSSSIRGAVPPPSLSGRTPISRAPKPAFPANITPQIISSSDTASYSLGRRPGNTAVRKKNVSGHTVIAEATKATGLVMAKQMEDIAESSRALERSKIDVQLKLFSEQMAYQREKDRRLYDNAVAANETARLSIIKQGEIVHCLAQLSTLLGRKLSSSSSPEMETPPQHTPSKGMTQHTYASGYDHGYGDGQHEDQNMNAPHTADTGEDRMDPQRPDPEQVQLPETATTFTED